MLNIAIEQNEITIKEQAYLLSPPEITRFYEVAQAGVIEFSDSLKDFFGENTEFLLNCLSFLPLPVLVDRVNLYHSQHLGFHQRFSGEIAGGIYTYIREKDALVLIDRITDAKKFKTEKGLNKIEFSLIAEFLNILANSLWKAITDKTALSWWLTPPILVNSLSRSLAYSARVYTLDYLQVHLEFLMPATATRVYLIILPNQNTLKVILSKLLTQPVFLEDQLV